MKQKDIRGYHLPWYIDKQNLPDEKRLLTLEKNQISFGLPVQILFPAFKLKNEEAHEVEFSNSLKRYSLESFLQRN